METVTVPEPEREKILAAPHKIMNETPSELLMTAIRSGEVSNLRVERITETLSEKDAKLYGHNTRVDYQAWIYYRPIKLTDTRLLKPRILCVSDFDKLRFEHCQDESWTSLDMEWMNRPILINGDLSDIEVKLLYDTVDKLGLVSRTDNETITSDKIFQILKHEYAGKRVNVYVNTSKEGYTDVIYLLLNRGDDGNASFELSEFRCSTD